MGFILPGGISTCGNDQIPRFLRGCQKITTQYRRTTSQCRGTTSQCSRTTRQVARSHGLFLRRLCNPSTGGDTGLDRLSNCPSTCHPRQTMGLSHTTVLRTSVRVLVHLPLAMLQTEFEFPMFGLAGDKALAISTFLIYAFLSAGHCMNIRYTQLYFMWSLMISASAWAFYIIPFCWRHILLTNGGHRLVEYSSL